MQFNAGINPVKRRIFLKPKGIDFKSYMGILCLYAITSYGGGRKMKKGRTIALVFLVVLVVSCTTILASAKTIDDIPPFDLSKYMLENANLTDDLKGLTGISSGFSAADFKKDKSDFTIGISFGDITNPVWAEIAETGQIFGKELGMSFIVGDAAGNVATQISQIENYIQSGVDGIWIGGVDKNAIKDVCKAAMDAGIPVIGIGSETSVAMQCLVGSDIDAGMVNARFAADWIIEKFPDGACEVAVINYPQETALLNRGDAIIKYLGEYAPNAKVVAVEAAINAAEGYTVTESILQAHPDVKVICTIGDGGAVGASNAVIAAGKNTDDFAVIGIDGSGEALNKIIEPSDPYRASVSFGGGVGFARVSVDGFASLFKGEDVKEVFVMPVIPVDVDLLPSYCIYAGYADLLAKLGYE